MNQTEVLLEFLRAGVLDRSPNIQHIESIDWERLLVQSGKQGVIAWVWDGICKLPISQQPPRQQRINWGLSAQEIWSNYQKHSEVLNTMIALCNDNNIRLLLLKGIGLSRLYPKPQSRPCGDIDIYLFDDYYKGNRVFTGHDVERIDKHATFVFNNLLVENHYYFLEPNTRQMRSINRYLESTLNDVCLTEGGYYTFSTIADFVFLTMHTLKHFRETKMVQYRNVMDFGMFLYRNSGKLQPSLCLDVLSSLNLVKGCELLVYLSEKILGIDLKEYHFHKIPKDDVEQIKATYLIENGDIEEKRSRSDLKKQYRCVWRYVPRYLSYYVIAKARLSLIIRSLFRIPASMSIAPWFYQQIIHKNN